MAQVLHIGSCYQQLLLESIEHHFSSLRYKPLDEYSQMADYLSSDDITILCLEKKGDEKDVINFVNHLLSSHMYVGYLCFFPPADDGWLDDQQLQVYLSPNPTTWQIAQAIRHLLTTIHLKKELHAIQQELHSRTQELAELNKIGIALSSERELDTLLDLILQKAREITAADAGSLYLIEKNPQIEADENNFWKDKQLRFKLAHNDSISASYQEFVMPVERKSMAGYTALSGRPLNIADAYHLPKNSAFQHNRSFDARMGYHTKSVLCIPLHSHQGELIGVLQLINRKKKASARLTDIKKVSEQVIPFDQRCEELALSLASQAAVSIENMRLYDEIKQLFEGFILASVHAIEQRDPTTFGHSERVATLTVAMAEQVSRQSYGPFKSVFFTREDLQQIRYAALLHDFGKIGVREKILVKANKLYPEQLDAILLRGQLMKKSLELDALKRKLGSTTENHRVKDSDLETAIEKQIKEIDRLLDFILKINSMARLGEKDYTRLKEIGNRTFAIDDQLQPLINEEEISLLSIKNGNLCEQERREIESHVTHTYNFLSRIPWATHLKDVPNIAYSHHEKLDGSGYPRGLKSDQIPLPARMMTIADIFDALTAWDRPYKKAVSIDRALDILEDEAKAGKLDADLLQIFIGAEIFKMVNRSAPNEK